MNRIIVGRKRFNIFRIVLRNNGDNSFQIILFVMDSSPDFEETCYLQLCYTTLSWAASFRFNPLRLLDDPNVSVAINIQLREKHF